jgi:alpha-1,2-mannosyltransferase
VQIRDVPVRTDFASYYLAGMVTRQGGDPYDSQALAAAGHRLGFDFDQYPFLYPPPFALCMAPLSLLRFETARALWMLLSTACLLASFVVIRELLLAQLRPRQQWLPGLGWLLLVPFVVMALNGTAVHNDVRSGSVGAMLLLALVLVLRACMRQQPRAAAIWLVVAALLKVTPVLLLPWLVWRLGRRALTTALLSGAVALVPALVVWGPRILWRYPFEALWPAAHLEHAWPHNVSLRAFTLRLLEAANGEVPMALVTGAALLLEALIVVGSIRALRRQPAPASRPLEFALLVLALLLVMRVTWVHTLTAMLFVWPLSMAACTALWPTARTEARQLMGWSCLGFFLTTAHLPVLWGERWMTWPWLLAPGLHTLGLVLLWGVVVRLLRRSAQPPGRTGMRLA